MDMLLFQGGAKRNSYHDISQRYGLNPHLTEEELQLQLEEMRENLKKEIRKEMKIKEGAEKLKEATTDKKSLSDVSSIVKKANSKLKDLHNELLEINSNLLMSNSHTHMESMSGKYLIFLNILCIYRYMNKWRCVCKGCSHQIKYLENLFTNFTYTYLSHCILLINQTQY